MNFIVVFGGVSFEHEISIVSAIALKKELSNITHFVFIDAQNDLYLIPRESMTSKHFSLSAYKKDAKVSFTKGGFLRKGLFKSEILSGVVINLIHGKSGEDGQIAGLLDFYQIPFIGPRIEACAISFSKELTKSYAKARGVKVLDYRIAKSTLGNSSLTQSLREFGKSSFDRPLVLSHSDFPAQPTNLAQDTRIAENVVNPTNSHAEFTFPCIIKPAHLGSSIGIAVAKESDDLPYALDCAFEYDSSVVIEPFIPHIREFNLAGCKVGNEFIFSIIEEVKKDEFFAFEDKYLDFQGGGKKKAANLSDEMSAKIQENFKAIYENCFEGALIRCDFFMLENEIYLNEINPIPGSLAYYLFDDFSGAIRTLAQNLPKERKIPIKYNYISKIQAQKGK